jgi:hypothetical protein
MAFKKGESGNPKGREAGKTPATALKKIIADNMPDILNAMIEQALAGDMVAAKALTDKVIPSIKPQALPIQIATGDSLVASGDNLITAALTGLIAPDIAAQLITALSNQAKLVEQEELIARIEKLEGGSNDK